MIAQFHIIGYIQKERKISHFFAEKKESAKNAVRQRITHKKPRIIKLVQYFNDRVCAYKCENEIIVEKQSHDFY